MKTVLYALGVILLGAIGWFGSSVSVHLYQDHQLIHAGASSAQYLFSPTEVKGVDGKPLSRAQLLDILLSKVVQGASSSTSVPPPAGEPAKR